VSEDAVPTQGEVRLLRLKDSAASEHASYKELRSARGDPVPSPACYDVRQWIEGMLRLADITS